MPVLLTSADFDRVAATLGVPAEPLPGADGTPGGVRFALADASSGRRLAVEVVQAGGASLVKVYGTESHLELHGCAGVVTSDELGEVIFFAREAGRVHGMVIEKAAACSLYANVSEKLLSADFLELAPEVAQAAVVLSMSEPFFEGDGAE
ncbi:MAG: hypothetical protein Rubg2KO_00700 [Rubricoccaceae bacterium]